MLLTLALVILIPIALIYPGWRKASQSESQGSIAFFLPTIGISLWLSLMGSGVGAQSLSNLVEVYFVCAIAVAVAYLKFNLLNARIKSTLGSGLVACGVLTIAVVALRLLMPVLPE